MLYIMSFIGNTSRCLKKTSDFGDIRLSKVHEEEEGNER